MSPATRMGIVLLSLVGSGCVLAPQAPGADQVKITRNAADVAGCTAMGNINRTAGGEPRNQAVGLGANVVFDTTPGVDAALGNWTTGVAYRCGSTATPSAK
jgi:hypothetical protein